MPVPGDSPSSRDIDTALAEDRRFPPDEVFAAAANADASIYERDFDEFWTPRGPNAHQLVPGEPVPPGAGGYLVLKRPWPAILRGLYKDDERYRATYWSRFEGAYFTGDGARVDSDGDLWLLGRVDDVMNVSGHRLSTIEIESALVDRPDVAEAAVVGRADEQTGQAIVGYVTLKAGVDASPGKLTELREHVAGRIGRVAMPANVVFTPELPKTRSGKIMRRLLRDVANNRELGDTTTLADPTVVEEIRTRATAEAATED